MCPHSPNLQVIIVIDRLAILLAVTALSLPGAFVSSAWAQSESGLKLGPSEEPAGKLDLGATPPSDSEQTPAARQDSGTAGASSQGQQTKVGAWNVACDGEGKNCAMAQIGNDSKGTPVLEMVIRKLVEPLEVGERTAIAVLDVITPLGVVLPEGLAVTIDKGQQETAPFQVCTEQGCLVREPIDSDLINRFKGGNDAVISVIAASQGEVSANISLSGFTKAYGSLK